MVGFLITREDRDSIYIQPKVFAILSLSTFLSFDWTLCLFKSNIEAGMVLFKDVSIPAQWFSIGFLDFPSIINRSQCSNPSSTFKLLRFPVLTPTFILLLHVLQCPTSQSRIGSTMRGKSGVQMSSDLAARLAILPRHTRCS